MSQVASMTRVSAMPRSWAGRRRAGMYVRRRRFQLDRALAQGADPWSAAELMIRASRLSSLSERRKLAAGLMELVSLAKHQRRPSPYVSVRHKLVLEQREQLVALAERLGQPAPIDVPVVAQIALLLSDPLSPAYQGGTHPQRLAELTVGCLERLGRRDGLSP
jgi:hypothetical protein